MDTSYSNEPMTEKVRKVLKNSNANEAVSKIQKYIGKEKNTPLDIAIIGKTGSGKSTFVNAFRGINNSDEGAAPTGHKKTTKEVTAYNHPNYPNVRLWDHPGIGTTRCNYAKFLKLFEFEKFDFFIIISKTRFRKNDVRLAKEIMKMGKKFYFVRSKIDKKSSKKIEKRLAKIKKKSVKGLEKKGIESPQVFLVSSFELHQFDFYLLHETLEKELPEQKRHVLLMVMPNINPQIIEKKKRVFQDKIKYIATLSAAAASVPVPGLSTAVDITLLVATVITYLEGFGLDMPSLRRLSAATNVPLQSMIDVMGSPLAKEKITKELLLKLLTKSATILMGMAAEELLRFIPILGIPASMALSYKTTGRCLQMFLDMIAEDAQKVYQLVRGSK